MNITITSADSDEYVFIKSVGVLEGKEDLIKHAGLVYQEIVKYGKHKILIDDIETRFPMNFIEYYGQVQSFSEKFPPEIRLFKIAVVLSPEFAEVGRFWETLSVNRGFQYFAFTSLEEAREWLLK